MLAAIILVAVGSILPVLILIGLAKLGVVHWKATRKSRMDEAWETAEANQEAFEREHNKVYDGVSTHATLDPKYWPDLRARAIGARVKVLLERN